MPALWSSTLLSILAACALVFGSAIPSLPFLRRHPDTRRTVADRLSLLIGFSAGLMLATALHELLPEALESNPKYAMWGVGFGFLVLYSAERLTHFHACRHRECEIELDSPAEAEAEHIHDHSCEGHDHEDDADHSHHTHSIVHAAYSHGHGQHSHHVGTHADTMALAGMSIHNFADGLTTAAAFAVSKTVGVVVVLAIVLHQMAAGLSLGAIMQRAGRNQRRVWFSTSAAGAFIVVGALFYHLIVPVEPHVTGIVLGIAAGSFLYVAACDLLPEAHADDEGWGVMATTIAGYLFALLSTIIFDKH